MLTLPPSPCAVAAFLEDREKRLRATALSCASDLMAGYMQASIELRAIRHDRVAAGCAQWLAAERAGTPPPLIPPIANVAAEVRL